MARNLKTEGNLVAAKLFATSVEASGSLSAGSVVARGVIRAESATFDTIQAAAIRSKSGGSVRINGNVSITNSAPSTALSSFLSMDERETASEVSTTTWRTVYAENFDSADTATPAVPQWSPLMTSTCGGTDVFLGGHCNLAGAATAATLAIPIPVPSAIKAAAAAAIGGGGHTMLRLRARAHCIDSWAGESLVLRVDDEVVWIDSCTSPLPSPASFAGLNVCGGDAPDARLSQIIDVVVPHHGQDVRLEVGRLVFR